jgi:putative aldouronate transport system substrate-binding protein
MFSLGKRGISMVLVALLLVSLLAGFAVAEAPAATAVAEPGWKLDTTPITINWYVNYSWYVSTWDTALYSQYMERKTGVKINFIVPAGNESEKLNTMIAGNTLPDMITLETTDPAYKQMVAAGLLYSVNDLADQYDPYFYDVTESQTLNWFASDDGKTYGYPNASITPSMFDKINTVNYQTFQVKKDYWEALGEPKMDTPENFLAALQAAKEMYATVDGQPLIPIGFHDFTETGNLSFDDYLLNYLGVPMELGGKLYDRREDAGYLTWLKTFRKAYELGLLSDDIFIDQRQQVEEKIAQNRYFALLFQNCDFVAEQQVLYEKDPESIFYAIQGPSAGNAPVMPGQSINGWTMTCVTKNAKDPARCIRFMSYWISPEGTRDCTFGEEGVTLQLDADGNPSLTPEYQQMYEQNATQYYEVTGADPLWMLANPLMANLWAPKPAPYLTQMYDWADPYIVSFAQYENIDPPTDSDEAQINADVKLLWGATLPALLRAASEEEFDATFQNYVTQRDALGYAQLLAYRQERLESNKAKLFK